MLNDMRCKVCHGGTNGRYGVYLWGLWRPVCRKDWGRLFTYTQARLIGNGVVTGPRGLGRPPRKGDDAIVQWARAQGIEPRAFTPKEVGLQHD